MHSEGPLKKKYDRKCVPVRRVSSWQREQIEKRQRHLKNFKGTKWQKLHREDELRKAKAAADGIRYVRLSSVRSASIAPNKVSRVAARRTRGVRFTAKKKNSHKPRGHLTQKPTKPRTYNEISHTTYRPAPRKYRYRREPPPPTPVTSQNLKKFTMEERRKRKGSGDGNAKIAESIFRQLCESIEKDPTSKVVRSQAKLLEGLRGKSPIQQTNTSLDRAEKQLWQLIRQRGDPYDIKLQARNVQRLRAEFTPTAPAAAEEDAPERHKPVKAEERREAAGPSPAPVSADKDARETSKPTELGDPLDPPSPPRHTARPVLEPKPAQAQKQENKRPGEPLDTARSHIPPPESQASASSVGDPLDPSSPVRRDREPILAPTPSQSHRQENKRPGTPLDANTRAQSHASDTFPSDSFDPTSPSHRGRQPISVPKPPQGQRQESKQPDAPSDADTRHKPVPESVASASSIGDPLYAPSPSQRARQPIPAQNKRPGAPLETGTRHKPAPNSIASASSIGDPLDAPSPPQRGRNPIPALKHSHLPREETARPGTAPESSGRTSKRPQSNASTSSVGSRFDLPSHPPRTPQEPEGTSPPPGKLPVLAPKPSQGHRQETARPSTASEATAHIHSHAPTSSPGSSFARRDNLPVLAPGPSQPRREENARPSTAPESSAPAPKRPQSSASASSHTSTFAIPPLPSGARQPTPLSRPSQVHREQTARPSTAPESSAATNKRPRSSASVSSRTSTFAVPASPQRGRERARTATPPPKRRRAATPENSERYLPKDSPSPPTPRPAFIPPRPRFKAKTSITDREDRASRALMHPASKPLAKLPDAAKLATGDFDRVARLQKPHPSFEKAKRDVNAKHVRMVNRAGGRGREVKEETRSAADRVGMPPGWREKREAERAKGGGAGAGQVVSQRGGGVVAGGMSREREEVGRWIDEEFGPGGGE
ncbi:hypothetical protein VF21_05381 [Pseudogymnoascus sp. 05NY08]|nr:hypothetical protein VF21_05381 [Pseudogymnoascus sp. 05NY08]